MENDKVYWLSPLGGFDDFGQPYKGEMFDAKTKFGPWACMTRESWLENRASPILGTGYGQYYVEQENGKWLKMEG